MASTADVKYLAQAIAPEKNDLDHTIVIAVFLIALGQALTILLTIRRERDIRELGKLVDRQRLQITELTAWLAGRTAAQPRRIKSEPKPPGEPAADASKTSESRLPPEPAQAGAAADETAMAAKVMDWQQHILAGLRAGINGGARPETAARTTQEAEAAPKGLPEQGGPGTIDQEAERATKPFRWFKDDAGEPPGIVVAREIVAGINGGAASDETAAAPKESPDGPGPTSTEDELERATKAINRLKEDADKAREIITSMHSASPAKKTG